MKRKLKLDLIQLFEHFALTPETPKYVSIAYAEVIGLLRQLDKQVLCDLTALFEPIRFARNEVMQAPQKAIDHLWLIEKGIARSYVDTGRKEQIHCFHFPGELTGHYCCGSLHRTCEMGIKTITKVRCWRVDIEELDALCTLYPAIAPLVLLWVKGKMDWITQLQCYKLKHSANDHYKMLMRHFPYYFQKIPLVYIASYLQVHPSTLSRYRARI